MDVAAPYSSVVPSLDGPVLEVLQRAGRPVTGRQLQRLARRGSVPGVAAVLDRLAESGIIHAERSGSAVLYSANREHLAWPAVDILMGIRDELVARLRRNLDGWDPRPSKAMLFGSTARGDGDARSDVDIVIVHANDEAPHEADLAQLRDQVRAWTGNDLQLVVASETTWQRMEAQHDPLVDGVRRDGLDLLTPPSTP